MKNNFSSLWFLWSLLGIICMAIILIGLSKALRKTEWTKQRRQKIFFTTSITVLFWIVMLTVLSYNGFFADFNTLPPRPVLALLIPLPVVLVFSFSQTGKRLLERVPPQWLVFMQTFRIFVELLIWFAFLANELPVQMSFEGKNFDVLAGLLALPAGLLLLQKKEWSSKIILIYNIIGLALLINILVIAVLSMPTPFRHFMNEPSAILIAHFPFILLPGLMVPIAYSMHIFSLRQPFIKKNSETIIVNN